MAVGDQHEPQAVGGEGTGEQNAALVTALIGLAKLVRRTGREGALNIVASGGSQASLAGWVIEMADTIGGFVRVDDVRQGEATPQDLALIAGTNPDTMAEVLFGTTPTLLDASGGKLNVITAEEGHSLLVTADDI